MARQLGGPLLCVGDLLSDLSLQDDDNNYNDSQQCSSSTFPQSQQTLHEIFENNYKDLNVALMNSDHSWTSLTQKVCTALKIADKLVQTSHVELEQLLEKVHTLENILKRGEAACNNFKLTEVKQNAPS